MTIDRAIQLLLTALMQARLARALYQGRDAVQELSAWAGASNFRYVDANNVCAAALIFHDHMHISIGGTNDRYDWLQNLTAEQRWLNDLQVHRGFADATEWLLPAMRRANLHEFAQTKTLYLGGHSAGGSIAQLLATYQGFEPREVIALGSPRLFSPESAAAYRAFPWEVHQFIADGDPVPHFPLRQFRKLFGKAQYANTESPLILKSDGAMATDRERGCVSRAMRVAKAWFVNGATLSGLFAGVGTSFVKSHEIDNYVALIEKSLGRTSRHA